MSEKIEILKDIFVEIEFVEDGANQAEKYFDFNKYKSSWHEERKNEYHITVLLYCKKKQYLKFKGSYTETLKERGGMYVGEMFHKEIQENVEFKDGFYITEFPFRLTIDLEDEEIFIVGKIDLIHNKEQKIEDIKTYFYLPKKLKDIDRKYCIQVISYIFILNNTYYEKDPLQEVYIICVSKGNCETKIVKMDYTKELGRICYNWILSRAKEFHSCIINNEQPKGDTSKWCQYCQLLELPCLEGREAIKGIIEPITLESTKFKKKYPEKKPYIKRNEKWIETKAFTKFKTELKKN